MGKGRVYPATGVANPGPHVSIDLVFLVLNSNCFDSKIEICFISVPSQIKYSNLTCAIASATS